ncbi:hypothetical protein E0Z10_g2161 [Xylaria hypoxylon]|uniref:Uncharacterized protein n=1 Tax=Xylaria hypoxylon TaxID=37992 RepID=A0A4Z0Z2X4_9PEZI|nr:hypothetical protein E0Z10_g2161 [Xylaria hypoxylon]
MLLSFFIASAIFISTLVLIEMFIIFISAVLVWTAVLAFFMLRDWRLLLKILRWSISIWLVIFGIVVSEVLREGLIVNGSAPLHWDVRLAWTVWFIIVACSFVDWRFLVPAVALPLWFVSHPEVQTLLNYGLVRLKWIGIVHSPLAQSCLARAEDGHSLDGLYYQLGIVDDESKFGEIAAIAT